MMTNIKKTVKNITFMIGVFIVLGSFPCLGLSTELTDKEILQMADASRGNLEGIIWTVQIVSSENNRENMVEYEVKARGFDVHATNTAPPKDKGNIILMVSGNMWFYKPGLSKAVPISRRQKLLGMAAYGDIAATNYAEDYISTALDEEMVENELCYVFDLKANTNKATYDRIKYWISKERIVGIKAEYFTVSGKLFKSAGMEYRHHVEIEGLTRPFISKIEIRDELVSEGKTVFTFQQGKIQKIPDYIFNLNLLRR